VKEPHFGWTRLGHPVHTRTVDHLPSGTFMQRVNKQVAIAVTRVVGSMWCAYAFALLAFTSLPAVIATAFHVHWFPQWLIQAGLIALVAWIAQTFLQLVLLSVIMVGQNVQQEASDVRAVKTFEDSEIVVDRLNLDTEGGIAILNEKLDRLLAAAGKVKTR